MSRRAVTALRCSPPAGVLPRLQRGKSCALDLPRSSVRSVAALVPVVCAGELASTCSVDNLCCRPQHTRAGGRAMMYTAGRVCASLTALARHDLQIRKKITRRPATPDEIVRRALTPGYSSTFTYIPRVAPLLLHCLSTSGTRANPLCVSALLRGAVATRSHAPHEPRLGFLARPERGHRWRPRLPRLRRSPRKQRKPTDRLRLLSPLLRGVLISRVFALRANSCFTKIARRVPSHALYCISVHVRRQCSRWEVST